MANQKLAAKITVCPDSGCWLWSGRLNRNGYGRAWCPETKMEPVVHRMVWQMLRGSIPDGLILDHVCKVRRCCNPRHLEVVTHKENTRRGDAVLFRRNAR